MTDPIITAARDILDDSLKELRVAVVGATPDELNRRPAGPDTNSIAVLVVHSLTSTRSWLTVATGAPLPERDRDAEFITVAESEAALLAFLDQMAGECRALLDTDAPFDAAVERPTHHRTDVPDTAQAGWALLHALEHLREHVAHTQLTRQLLAARSV